MSMKIKSAKDLKDLKLKKNKRVNASGHILTYKPDHPTAYSGGNWDGYVYEHRYVAEINLSRPLEEGEEVHHLDNNPQNNSWDNLLVLSKSMHQKLHDWLNKGGLTVETGEVNGVNSEKPVLQEPTVCKVCSDPIPKWQVYCSKECRQLSGVLSIKGSSTERPTPEQLAKDLRESNYCAVGRKYGVSDNAIRKWVKCYTKYGVWQP